MCYRARAVYVISVAMLVGVFMPPLARAGTVLVAQDDASNYTNWGVTGLDEGVGLDAWVFHVTPEGGFAGNYLADTNSQATLNSIESGAAGKAWGMYANGGGPSDFPRTAVFRGFGYNGSLWANNLANPGDRLKLSMESGAIALSASCGFALRSGNADFSADDYNNGSLFEFGLYSSPTVIDPNFSIYDGSGGKVDTGIPWATHQDGLDFTFTLTGSNTYDLAIYDASSPSTLLTNIVSTLNGNAPLDSIALFNRDVGTSFDVFFNKIEIHKYYPPTLFMVK
ncbi:MAG: hypothetical protein HQ523_15245 [Lentisphaerae bacterium]|nr:hypothetical protein [Lentisphaerota bacterium]